MLAIAMATDMESNGILDPKLWSTLHNHVDLKHIYAKLPLREIFRLRLVCKEWNRLASDREFLETSFSTPLAKPYFLFYGVPAFENTDLHCLLSYDASTRGWKSTALPYRRYRFLEVEGLLYNCSMDEGYYAVFQEVFNLHTGVTYQLPRVPEAADDPFIALRVDTSVWPYSFQVIYGSTMIPTQIYDSRTDAWTIKAGNHPDMAPGQASCAEANGFMYIRSELDGITTYDLEKDHWNMYIAAPPGDCDDYFRSIAAWQGRLFDVTVSLKDRLIAAWELVDHSKQKWEAAARMPDDLFSWITYEDNPEGHPVNIDSDAEIRTSFCGEYVLVYTWLREEGIAERFVMGNLDSKAWEKVEVPFGAFCILQECEYIP